MVIYGYYLYVSCIMCVLFDTGDKIQADGINLMNDLKAKIVEYNVKSENVTGVATEVFRKAKNGLPYLESLNLKFGFNISIATQLLEARLGYLSAISLLDDGIDKSKLIAWDSGKSIVSFELNFIHFYMLFINIYIYIYIYLH